MTATAFKTAEQQERERPLVILRDPGARAIPHVEAADRSAILSGIGAAQLAPATALAGEDVHADVVWDELDQARRERRPVYFDYPSREGVVKQRVFSAWETDADERSALGWDHLEGHPARFTYSKVAGEVYQAPPWLYGYEPPSE